TELVVCLRSGRRLPSVLCVQRNLSHAASHEYSYSTFFCYPPSRCDMRSCRWGIFFFFAWVALIQAQQKAETLKPVKPFVQSAITSDSTRLPVKRVVLYKNGVGYFEHSAQVHGDQELAIDFTTAQMNYVIKSLTVVDLGEGHISGVRYNSIAPLDERLKALRLPFGEQVSRS